LPAADVAQQLGRDVDFVLPADKHVVIAANAGEPYVMRASRWFGYGPPLRRLVADLDTLGSAAAVPIISDEPITEDSGDTAKRQEQVA
jgi:hypothetical protein